MKILLLAVLLLLAGCTANQPPRDVGAGAPKPQILAATFGLNCRGVILPSPFKNTVVSGNVTAEVKDSCDGQTSHPNSCAYVIHLDVIPDPAPTCMKGFDITWRCDEQVQATHLDVSSDGANLLMSCAPLERNGRF